MNELEVTKQLKNDIKLIQIELKNAIRNHQNLLSKHNSDPFNVELQKDLNKAEEEIIFIGLDQKRLLERLREEYKTYQKSVKSNIIKNGIEERRLNLTNALNRARKQNIIHRNTSANSYSDESPEILSDNSLPEQNLSPNEPHDLSQTEFLTYFGLATHDVFKEMQNKRAERKRRSTANPHFLYGNKGWDFLTHSKRKRNAFLLSPPSPPNTRQSVRKKQERISPPLVENSNSESTENVPANKNVLNAFPSIPNLPSGLIIERVSPDNFSPDSKTCIICKQPGVLSVCDVCSNGFHISCHNRPLTQTPHQCPKCINKEVRTVGSLNVPSGMTVSCITPDLTEKINEKKQLEEKNQNLTAELIELQNRHSQLTISLNNEKKQQEQLITTQQTTEEKIQQILTFIENVQKPLKNSNISSRSSSSSSSSSNSSSSSSTNS